RDETTLVSQMIRVAICSLGLSVTWQALQADGWSDEQLAQMQKSWEGVQMLDVMEKGFTGERLHAASHIRWLRETGTNYIDWSFSGRPSTLRDRLFTTVWRLTVADRDQLFYVSTMQKQVEHSRLASKGAPLYEVAQLLDGDAKFVMKQLDRSDARF